MRRLAKNLILATAVVSAIFIVDLSSAGAASLHQQPCITEKIGLIESDSLRQYIDFWGKFRDTVMPDPDEPQNNNPPKEMEKPKPKPVNPKAPEPTPGKPPHEVRPKAAD